MQFYCCVHRFALCIAICYLAAVCTWTADAIVAMVWYWLTISTDCILLPFLVWAFEFALVAVSGVLVAFHVVTSFMATCNGSPHHYVVLGFVWSLQFGSIAT